MSVETWRKRCESTLKDAVREIEPELGPGAAMPFVRALDALGKPTGTATDVATDLVRRDAK